LCVAVQNPIILYFAHGFHPLCVDLDAPVSHLPTLYDLVANVTHESVAGTTRDKKNTVWKVHVRAGSGGGDGEKWFQIQDLIVEETRKEMIFLGETVLQVAVLRPLVGQPDSDMRI
jgi:U4/U6.U5 tri-snRNP-associated protein 2